MVKKFRLLYFYDKKSFLLFTTILTYKYTAQYLRTYEARTRR